MSPRADPMPGGPRGFQERDVTLPNGLTIHYFEWPGPRPNLVLLHPSSGYEVEGDYALQMENPAGLAEALVGFAAQAVKD